MTGEEGDSTAGDAEPDKPSETDSAKSRHWLTNDAAALAMVITMCLHRLLSYTEFFATNPLLDRTFAFGFAVAVVWLFGRGAAKLVRGS